MTDAPCPAHRRPIRLPPEAYRGGDPFLITICTASRAPILTSAPMARAVAARLDPQLVCEGGPVGVWCAMPDHLHMILTRAPDIIQWVAQFKAATTTVARNAGLVGHLWQRRFHDRRLDPTTEALETVTAYILQNPVRRGLVERWEDWPWVRVGWRP